MNPDPSQLVSQSRETFIRLSSRLLSAIDALEQLKREMPEIAANNRVQEVDAALSEAFCRAREHQTEAQALADLNARLLRQYQSARESFAAGWDARLADIMAHLSNEDVSSLWHVLEEMIDNDEDSPF